MTPTLNGGKPWTTAPVDRVDGRRQAAEVDRADDADEHPEDQDEPPLRDQIGLAGLVDQLRDLEHRPVHRQVLQVVVDDQAEHQAEDADAEAAHQQGASVDPLELDRPEVGQHEVRFAAGMLRRGAACVCGRRRRGLHGQAGSARHQTQSRQRARHVSACATVELHLAINALLRQRLSTRENRRPGRCHAGRESGRGSAIPPVRKIRMPCSTVMSGNDALSR